MTNYKKSLNNILNIIETNKTDKYAILLKNFILNWWNDGTFGHISFMALACLDDQNRQDFLNVFNEIAKNGFCYPAPNDLYYDRIQAIAINEIMENEGE